METNPIDVVSSFPVPMGASGTSTMSVGRALDPQATPWLRTATSVSRHDISGAHRLAAIESGRSIHWQSVVREASNYLLGFKLPFIVFSSAHIQ